MINLSTKSCFKDLKIGDKIYIIQSYISLEKGVKNYYNFDEFTISKIHSKITKILFTGEYREKLLYGNQIDIHKDVTSEGIWCSVHHYEFFANKEDAIKRFYRLNP